jgi:hypothetical protein
VIRIASHFSFNKAEGESEAAQRCLGPSALNEKSKSVNVLLAFADAGYYAGVRAVGRQLAHVGRTHEKLDA